HMADSLLSPAVGGAMWAVSAGTLAVCSSRVQKEGDERKVPLMGVFAAFVFAAQMINFAIPGTGSSGHLGGSLLLAILLGPCAGFLAIASVLVVQALFFADGGLLALGCNMFNIGFIPALIAFPLVYAPLAGDGGSRGRRFAAALLAAVAAAQAGSLAVVAETSLSGISAIPPARFVLLMQPLHLVIGLTEGIATYAIVSFVAKARPDLVNAPRPAWGSAFPAAVLGAALVTAALLPLYASAKPDALEHAVATITGGKTPDPRSAAHRRAAEIQRWTALMPEYSFLRAAGAGEAGAGAAGAAGVLLTLGFVAAGRLLRRRRSG
ncbi:MAG TPA: energy-coupling factor ABC transporter permease, partial [Verrucomicrobiae bacterium]|nr:energy-coupling factor ABC transporter permease [Verrucomicrobiae bacterium]